MNRLQYILQLLIFVVLFAICTGDAIAHEVDFSFSYDNNELQINGRASDGWKVYSNIQGDTGIPFSIQSQDSKINIRTILWPETKSVTEDIEGTKFTTHYFDQDFIISATIHPELNDKVILPLKISYGACNNICLQESQEFELTINNGQVVDISNKTDKASKLRSIPIYHIILLAVLGGMILNIMPCVLPVLGIKILSLVNSRHNTSLLCLTSAFGIILSFAIFGLITIILQYLGHSVGWGFHFQNPNFLLFIIFVLLIFSSSLWGDFELQMPGSVLNVTSRNHSNEYLNSFLTGIFTSILATPCTAPFLSSAVALSLSQDAGTILITFVSIGVGMSVPFLLTAALPEIIHLLPKPGRWMNNLKKFFALLLITTAVWLLYIISLLVGYFYTLLFAALCIAVRFVILRSQYKAVIIAIFAIFIFGLLNTEIESIQYQTQKSRYGQWQQYHKGALTNALDNNKTVLLNITAEWCLTCKFNEIRVLNNHNMISYFEDHDVVLFEADVTFDKVQEIQDILDKHNRPGIPLTIVYSNSHPDGIALSEILSVQDVVSAIEESQ